MDGFTIAGIMSNQQGTGDREDEKDKLILQMINAFQIVIDHKDEKGPEIVKCLVSWWGLANIPAVVLLAAYLYPSFINQKHFYFDNVTVMRILEEIRDHWETIDPPKHLT